MSLVNFPAICGATIPCEGAVIAALGIVVGVFSIISVMTAMGVMRNSIEKGMSQLQVNTFQIQKFPQGFDGGHEARMRLRNRKDITYEQALLVRDRTSLAEAVGIESWQFGKIAFWEGNKTNPNVQIAGETPDGIITNDWVVAEGRGLWDGVRNHQAANAMKAMTIGDRAFFYHSSCEEPGIAGIVEVARAASPDATQFDPASKYFDPKATSQNPRWFNVEVKFISKTRLVGIKELRNYPELASLRILQTGNRLSITPVDPAEWVFIMGIL